MLAWFAECLCFSTAQHDGQELHGTAHRAVLQSDVARGTGVEVEFGPAVFQQVLSAAAAIKADIDPVLLS